MEIEQKFRVEDPALFIALRELHRLDAYMLYAQPEPERQHNIYFDTVDRRIRSQGYGLRIREIDDGRRIATLKGAAQNEGARFVRHEWEVEVGPDDHPSTWPASEARERTLALLAGESPLRLLTIDTVRYHIIAMQNERRVAEISLDQGTIDAAGLREEFCELEIELLGDGTMDDLDSLCLSLQKRFRLIPDERTKLARGLALLQKATSA